MKIPAGIIGVAVIVAGITATADSGFQPDQIDGLQLWLDASVAGAVSVAEDGRVTEWKDSSSNKYNAVQWVGAYRPELVRNAFGNKTMVRFDASGQVEGYGGTFMKTDCIPASGGMYGDGARTLVIAVANVGHSGWKINHVLHYGSPFDRQAYGITSCGGGIRNWGNHYWPHGFDTGIRSAGGGFIVVASYSDGVDRFTVNGDKTATNEIQLATAAGTYGKWGMIIGARIDPVWGKTTEGCCADIGEVLAFSTALSVADRQKIEGYLAHKWGMRDMLPAGHPYKLRAPGMLSAPPRASAEPVRAGAPKPSPSSPSAAPSDAAKVPVPIL